MSIALFGVAVSLLIQLVNFFVLDKESIRDLKAKQKKLQEEMKQHKTNPQKMSELNQELVGHSLAMMKHSFKPMLITLVPILILFSFLKGAYTGTELEATKFIFPIWLWYYIGSSIVASIVFRKLLKLP